MAQETKISAQRAAWCINASIADEETGGGGLEDGDQKVNGAPRRKQKAR
jgi:hypothetical protein